MIMTATVISIAISILMTAMPMINTISMNLIMMMIILMDLLKMVKMKTDDKTK